MFLIKDPKKTASTIIMGAAKPKAEEGEGEGQEQAAHDRLMFASDALKAIEQKDAKALEFALEQFARVCFEQWEKEPHEEYGEEE